MQVHFINTPKQLKAICQEFSHSEFLALDTEFVRQTTYYPILALIQICDGQQIATIDPVAIDDLGPLMELLYDDEIIKVLHSARQDLEIFYSLKQSVPKNIFDTQIASALLGYGEQIGYAALVKQLLKVELDKSQTRTDWLKRPLSPKQLTYAADDVRYLATLYPMQKKQLEQQGRLSWLENDFRFLANESTYAPSPETIWRKIRGVNRLKKQKLAIVQNLSIWRENQAIKRNLPRRRVLGDDLFIELANNPPENLTQLTQVNGLSNKFIHYNGTAILASIQQGLNTPDQDCPKLPNVEKLSQDEEALADCLMAVIHLCAHDNHISPNCLCSRKELNALIKGQRELNILSGWRNELAGKHLVKFLSGESQLSFLSGRLKLIETLPA